MTYDSINLVSLRLKRDKKIKINKGISHPSEIYPILKKMIGNSDREYFAILMLDVHGMPTNIQIVAIGKLTEIELHPREVFKAAIVSNSTGIILAHNHPSGSYTPSNCDIITTKKMVTCGKLLGIPVMDHIIITNEGTYSLRLNGDLDFN